MEPKIVLFALELYAFSSLISGPLYACSSIISGPYLRTQFLLFPVQLLCFNGFSFIFSLTFTNYVNCSERYSMAVSSQILPVEMLRVYKLYPWRYTNPTLHAPRLETLNSRCGGIITQFLLFPLELLRFNGLSFISSLTFTNCVHYSKLYSMAASSQILPVSNLHVVGLQTPSMEIYKLYPTCSAFRNSLCGVIITLLVDANH